MRPNKSKEDECLHALVSFANESAQAYDKATVHFWNVDTTLAETFAAHANERRRFAQTLESVDHRCPTYSGLRNTLPSGGTNLVHACAKKDRALLSACLSAQALGLQDDMRAAINREIDRIVMAIGRQPHRAFASTDRWLEGYRTVTSQSIKVSEP